SRPRIKARHKARCRMPALRQSRRLFIHDLVDAKQPDRRARHLSARRIQTHSRGAASFLRRRSDWRNLGHRSERRDILNRTSLAVLNYGLKTVPAARGALIFASFPLLTLVVAALLGHERVTVRKISGILATLLGVFLALSDKVLNSASVHGWSALGGELAILASAA